jgi:hypothetical protein
MTAVLSRLAGSARPDALHLPLQRSARPLIDPEDRIQAQAILGDYIEDLPDAGCAETSSFTSFRRSVGIIRPTTAGASPEDRPRTQFSAIANQARQTTTSDVALHH